MEIKFFPEPTVKTNMRGIFLNFDFYLSYTANLKIGTTS